MCKECDYTGWLVAVTFGTTDEPCPHCTCDGDERCDDSDYSDEYDGIDDDDE
jgi:hypothetical protein